MIVMLDTPQDIDVCAAEMGMDPGQVEQLYTPLTRRDPQRPDQAFAMDNGAFSRFDSVGFEKMLAKHRPRQKLCRFVAAPDVVGSAIRTLECFEVWKRRLDSLGWPVALVAQDGQESLPIPWESIAAVFIGGSTRWKDSKAAADIVRTAKIVGKWVHVGRINTPGRFEVFEALGADSCDGTGLARYSHMRAAIHDASVRPKLDFEAAS